MTDHNDPSSRSAPPPSPTPPRSIENVAQEDLVSLQSALAGWQDERESLLARLRGVETDARAKLHDAEHRLHHVVSQLEATQRSAHAVRVRLEADVQAARTRAEQVQQALGTTHAVAEELRVVNAELSTALDATQWRLSQLEAESASQGEALRQAEDARQAERDHLIALERVIAAEQQAAGAASDQHAAQAAALAALHVRTAQLEETIHQLQAERAQLVAAAQATEQQRTSESHERDVLRRELNELDAERALRCEREATLQGELDALRDTHERTRTAASDEIAALRADLVARDHALAEAAEAAAQAHTAHTAELQTWQDTASQHQADLAAARDQVAVLAARAQGQEEERLAALQQRQRLDHEFAEMRAEQLEKEAQQRDERNALSGRLRSLEEGLQERDVIIERLRGAEDELQRLQAAHGEELNAWHEISAQREADLVASRDALASQLADERAQTCDARDHATSLAARIQDIETERRVADEQRLELEQHLAAAHRDLDQIQGSAQTERSRFEADLQRLHAAHAEALEAVQQRTAQHADEREVLASRIGLLEDELRQRDAGIERLRAEIAQLHEQNTQARQAAGEAARRREDEWRATHKTTQDELANARRALADAEAARHGAEQCGLTLEEQLARGTAELNEIRAQTEAAIALAREKTEACVAAEQRAADSELRCGTLAEELDGSQKQAIQAQHRLDAMVSQIAELENERSPLNLRVDELTALTGELERECERLRRDRGSSEDTRRLKAENARLEAKIVELDRQRGEAVQRHSAAVAGYMVELNQRSEALRTRDAELQKATEELALVKQSCEDAMGELEVQRREHAALDRQLAELRATPTLAVKPPAAEPSRAAAAAPARASAAPPAAAQPSVSKSAKRPTQGDSIAGPVTVVHLEENKTLCDAAREIVSRRQDSDYTNALDSPVENASGSRLLAVNLLSRAHDPVAAILSFIAADTYHQSVLAYCVDGANGFSFGMADFFAQPVDPDACVARLLESVGTIQRLLVVTENFSVVGALREVLSRMRSSVSAALDLRQVVDLVPMVEPDVVLIDLALPRGEGLRLVSRLRSDPKTRDLALGILLAPPGNPAEFRQHALRAARDLPMSAAALAETIGERLGAVPTSVTARLQQTADARA